MLRVDLTGCVRVLCVLALAAAAAVAEAGDSPLEYLDEDSGATVVVVKSPLIFVRERSDSFAGVRDYVTLAAASIDQSGKVAYVFIAYFWGAGEPESSSALRLADEPIVLDLHDSQVVLTPDKQSAREAGIARQVHSPPFGHARPYIYSADLATMRSISQAKHLTLYDENLNTASKFELFEDRLDALQKFVSRMSDRNSGLVPK